MVSQGIQPLEHLPEKIRGETVTAPVFYIADLLDVILASDLDPCKLLGPVYSVQADSLKAVLLGIQLADAIQYIDKALADGKLRDLNIVRTFLRGNDHTVRRGSGEARLSDPSRPVQKSPSRFNDSRGRQIQSHLSCLQIGKKPTNKQVN
jgi:hypothetical protein